MVAGVGVDSGHQAFNDAEFVLQDFGHRCQAVGGAGCAGDDGFAAVQGFVVDVVNDGFDVVAARCGDDDFFRAGFDVFFGFVLAGEEAGAFEDDVNAQFAPRQFFRVGVGEYFDFFAVDHEVVAIEFGGAVEAALCGVVFEEVQQHVCRGEVVHGNDFNAFGFVHLAQGKTADASESVDGYFDTHRFTPRLWVEKRARL